jgi:transposase
MRKALKYRLYPTKKQEQVLFWTLARCRELYNAALSEWKDAYQQYERTQLWVNAETGQVIAATMVAKQRVRSVTYYKQKRDLPEIKGLREEYQDIQSQVLQDVLLQIVSHKAACAGRTVLKVSPRYTSQACSQCGTVRRKELSERWHSCACGCELDRDVNAAINILRLGRSQRGDAPCVEAPCL